MEKRNVKIFGIYVILLFGIFSFIALQNNFVSSVGEVTVCAEKTLSGALCQNVPVEQADKNFKVAPTACESTSYCKPGTCVNTEEGLCMENAPDSTCNKEEGGTWYDSLPDELPQCQLGCCLVGEQAAFTTQIRCKQLSSFYGLETNYRTDINSEIACIASAAPKVKGACVFEQEFQRTCKLTTREECNEVERNTGESAVDFHAGFLCSAEELATNCGPSAKTTLIDGKDEVYFVDTCGNQANIYDKNKIYDANKEDNKDYWKRIYQKSESCGFGFPNTGDTAKSCGNCDYLRGSVGKANVGGNPDYICKDLSCNFEGTDYQHGETWCATNNKAEGASKITVRASDFSVSSTERDLPGSRYFRLVCYNGDVTVEPCADFRQEVCIQSEIQGFKTAACRVNMWQDCVAQTTKKDCENTDRRDCRWGGRIVSDRTLVPDAVIAEDRCVPNYAPGFDFYNAESESSTLCLQASDKKVVKFRKDLSDLIEGSGWDCYEGCEFVGLSVGQSPNEIKYPLDNPWVQGRNNLCQALGDCGADINYKRRSGFTELSELIQTSDVFEPEDRG